MVEMISKTNHRYANRDVKTGEHFKVEDRHVPLMMALGRANLANPDAAPAPYVTRDMAAAPPAAYVRRRASSSTPEAKEGEPKQARPRAA